MRLLISVLAASLAIAPVYALPVYNLGLVSSSSAEPSAEPSPDPSLAISSEESSAPVQTPETTDPWQEFLSSVSLQWTDTASLPESTETPAPSSISYDSASLPVTASPSDSWTTELPTSTPPPHPAYSDFSNSVEPSSTDSAPSAVPTENYSSAVESEIQQILTESLLSAPASSEPVPTASEVPSASESDYSLPVSTPESSPVPSDIPTSLDLSSDSVLPTETAAISSEDAKWNELWDSYTAIPTPTEIPSLTDTTDFLQYSTLIPPEVMSSIETALPTTGDPLEEFLAMISSEIENRETPTPTPY